jgi:hypothetical protein
MPFTSVLGASSVIKPGVCTSSTRPTAPYVGQLVFETDTNRLVVFTASGWVYQTATGAPGLVLVKSETSFSGSSSVTADGVFTSTYTNYRVDLRYETSGSGNEVRLRLRTGGTSTSSNYNVQQMIFDHATSFSSRQSSLTSFPLSGQTNGSFVSAVTCTIFGPQLTSPTQFIANNAPNQGAYTTPQAGQNSGNQSSSTSFDGIEFFPTSGSPSTMTGSYTIYGLAKS